MNRIAAAFRQERKALVTYFTAGYPTMDASEEAIACAIESGADVVELGIPFSDPTADGTVIQQAGQTALKNGTTFRGVLELARRLRERFPKTPLVLFGYYNVFFHYGLEKLLGEMYSIVDGLLIVDLPFEERDEVKPLCDAAGISLIPLVAPTTGIDRAAKIVADCTGFVYYITVCGVTGERGELPPELAERLAALKRVCPVPLVAGFGVADGAMAAMAARHADGVVVGSALVKRQGDQEQIKQLTRELVKAL